MKTHLNNTKKKIIFIFGPTASGKTDLAIAISKKFPVEIISVDSVMVYKECNIGSAKPPQEILKKYKHHLVDKVDLKRVYTAADFCKASLELIPEIYQRKKIPLFVGGSMMYFKSLVDGMHDLPSSDEMYRKKLNAQKKKHGLSYLYKILMKKDANYAKKIQANDEKRIFRALEIIKQTNNKLSNIISSKDRKPLTEKYNILQYGLVATDRSKLHKKIEDRLVKMFDDGLIDETKEILDKKNISKDHPIFKAINYRQVIGMLNNEYDHDVCFQRALFATRQLSKRQATWIKSWKGCKELDFQNRKFDFTNLKKVL